MGSDFSALDAELATLETGPAVEVLSLAHAYAGTSLELIAVDAVLNELDADGPLLRTRSSFPPERKQRRSDLPHAGAPQASEEIVLPEPVPREPQRSEPGSGEMPLHVMHENQQRARSGSYSLEQQAKPAFKAGGLAGRDDTLEPFDEELIDDDEDLIEFTAATPSANDSTSESARPARRDSLFAKAGAQVSAQEEADAAFEELFSEAATRNSSIPSTRNSQLPETYNDDTETFDTSALGFIENDTSNSADVSMDEELDSAEFEIVVDGDASKGAAVRNPSDGPEKRPSFLGRLFGRKDE